MALDQRTENGLYLFKSLVKSSCVWEGDVMSRQWSEYLAVPVGNHEQVERQLEGYTEGTDYKAERDDTGKLVGVWIA